MDWDFFKILALVLMALFIIIFGPLITIWALNLIFGLTIPTTFATWFAILWLGGVVNGFSSRSK